jgi:Uma2 family endonuclease
MTAAATLPLELITTEELLAMPDGMDRDLIRGRLREPSMTRRNRLHSRTEAIITRILDAWRVTRPQPQGEVVVGEAGFRILKNPDTTVGIDVAYISPEMAAANPIDTPLIDGPPVLAVEILSPSDSQEGILEKVREYLDAGVKLVWVVEPVFKTVCVYRPDAPPELFNETEELSGEPHLPGFRAAVADLFGKW